MRAHPPKRQASSVKRQAAPRLRRQGPPSRRRRHLHFSSFRWPYCTKYILVRVLVGRTPTALKRERIVARNGRPVLAGAPGGETSRPRPVVPRPRRPRGDGNVRPACIATLRGNRLMPRARCDGGPRAGGRLCDRTAAPCETARPMIWPRKRQRQQRRCLHRARAAAVPVPWNARRPNESRLRAAPYSPALAPPRCPDATLHAAPDRAVPEPASPIT